MRVGEALERQAAALAWVVTPDAAAFLRHLYGVERLADPAERAHMLSVAERLGQHMVARSLGAADTYTIAADLIAAITHAADSLPDWTLTPELVPGHDGFVWLDQPVELPFEDRVPSSMRALTWSQIEAPDSDGQPAAWHLLTVPWLDTAVIPLSAADRSRAPALIPLSAMLWLAGGSLSQLTARGLTPGYAGALRWLGALLLFLAQRVVVPTRYQAERGVRRRVMRVAPNLTGDVLAITLRQPERVATTSPTARPVAWSYRWLVSGHWRRQYYPSLGRRQPRWIAPYVKGDADKPLRVTQRVFKVIR